MNGKIVGGVILVAAAIAGLALYYLQVYGYYHEAPAPDEGVSLVSISSNASEPILTDIVMERYLAQIEALADAVVASRWRPDWIVGVGRGGLAPATWLSHALGRPMLSVDLSAQLPAFADALLRLLQLGGNPADTAILGEARLRELYYAILKGEAGRFARQAFGAGNAIARSIAHVSSHLDAPISIDDMASRAGMSRAAFHRKFKQVTTMAPIQFVKSMRLNNAAMKIAGGMSVNEAAVDVGYVSPSQFSREFRRMYGQSPRQWGEAQQFPVEMGQ